MSSNNKSSSSWFIISVVVLYNIVVYVSNTSTYKQQGHSQQQTYEYTISDTHVRYILLCTLREVKFIIQRISIIASTIYLSDTHH